MSWQFPWRRTAEPEPELLCDWYFDMRTGWHDRTEEVREAGRIAALEAAARATDEMRDAPRLDGFTPAPPRRGLELSATGGFRDVELEAREGVRMRNLEESLASRERSRHGPSTDGFVHRGPDFGRPANLPGDS